MSWLNKIKIPQQSDVEEILTPNFLQILVGENEDLVLIYQDGFNNWNLPARNVAGNWVKPSKNAEGSWDLPSKILP